MNVCTKCRGKKRGGPGEVKRGIFGAEMKEQEFRTQVSWEKTEHTQNTGPSVWHFILFCQPVVHLKNVMAAISVTRFHWVPYVILPQYGLESWPIPVAGQQSFRTRTLEAESLWVWILLLPLGSCVTQTSCLPSPYFILLCMKWRLWQYHLVGVLHRLNDIQRMEHLNSFWNRINTIWRGSSFLGKARGRPLANQSGVCDPVLSSIFINNLNKGIEVILIYS